jgi:hypothetical protein
MNTDTLKIQNGIGDLYERAPTGGWCDHRQAVKLIDHERLVLPVQSRFGHGLIYNTYTIGSVVSGALRDGDDPVKALDRARSFGHELVFIFANGSCIHNGPRSTTKHVLIEIGMTVRFEGNLYTIETAPNDNIWLKPIVDESGATE